MTSSTNSSLQTLFSNLKKLNYNSIIFYTFLCFNLFWFYCLLMTLYRNGILMEYAHRPKSVLTYADRPLIIYHILFKMSTILFFSLCSIALFKRNPYWCIFFILLPFIILITDAFLIHDSFWFLSVYKL